MLPSGATAGPSVSPPEMGVERVNSSSSLASGETMLSPVGRGTSANAGTASNATNKHTRARRLMKDLRSAGDGSVHPPATADSAFNQTTAADVNSQRFRCKLLR